MADYYFSINLNKIWHFILLFYHVKIVKSFQNDKIKSIFNICALKTCLVK